MFSRVDRLIQSVGMETFIEYFVQFAHTHRFTYTDLYNILAEEKGYSDQSIKTKIYAGRKIFEEDLEQEALEKIMKSRKVDEEIRRYAQSYLEEIQCER